ncbi:MAG: sulfatase [Planctomycetota bacterium]|jgi:arylsulfatase A-like enzyme|nr:sulfatase [Planctomycetota bacterium]
MHRAEAPRAYVTRCSSTLRKLTKCLRPGLSILLGLCLACSTDTASTPEPVQRDVILIVLDTLRADHVSSYGYERMTTPTLDKLAAQGVRIDDVTAQSSWTGPSMVSMFLSRRVAGDFVRMPPYTTLAEHMNAHGWRTVGFQDNIMLAPGTGYDRGFELYEMEPGPGIILPAINDKDPRPLFAYFHFVGPHDPWTPAQTYDVFKPGEISPEVRAAYGAYLHDLDPTKTPLEIDLHVESASHEIAKQIALYDGDILQADAKVEYVLGALDRAGRLEDALVIIASDHGEGLWQHRVAELAFDVDDARRNDLLSAFKRTHNTLLYEELTRVPLIFSGPGVPEGVVLPGPAENVDLVPTLLDLLNLPPLPGTDGRTDSLGMAGQSLLPSMRDAAEGRPSVGRREVVSNTNQFTAVRTADGKKLIVPWDSTGPDSPKAFQLQNDGGEQRPIALERDVLTKLMESISALRSQGLKPTQGEGDLDEITRERMRALGYLGGSDEEGDTSGR